MTIKHFFALIGPQIRNHLHSAKETWIRTKKFKPVSKMRALKQRMELKYLELERQNSDGSLKDALIVKGRIEALSWVLGEYDGT